MSHLNEPAERLPSPAMPSNHAANAEEEISLTEIARALYARKWLVAGVTLLCALIATGVAFSMTPIYRADVLLAPVEEGGGKGGLSALAGQLGGLASLAGVSLGGAGSRGESIATLNSRALTEGYIKSNELMPILFYKKWDAEHKQWRPSLSKTPTLWDATQAFNEDIRKVSDDKRTGLITLTIEWRDAKLAAQWANDLVKVANTTLRARAIDTSNRNLAYLYEQLDKTSVIELRQAIYRLIETEVKNVMVAQGSEEYAFKIIDPAVAPERKTKPQRALIIIIGTLLGLLLGCAYALSGQTTFNNILIN